MIHFPTPPIVASACSASRLTLTWARTHRIVPSVPAHATPLLESTWGLLPSQQFATSVSAPSPTCGTIPLLEISCSTMFCVPLCAWGARQTYMPPHALPGSCSAGSARANRQVCRCPKAVSDSHTAHPALTCLSTQTRVHVSIFECMPCRSIICCKARAYAAACGRMCMHAQGSWCYAGWKRVRKPTQVMVAVPCRVALVLILCWRVSPRICLSSGMCQQGLKKKQKTMRSRLMGG